MNSFLLECLPAIHESELERSNWFTASATESLLVFTVVRESKSRMISESLENW